jgi:hypothetical protein
VGVGSGGDEIVGENKAVSVELEEAVVVAGIVEWVEVHGREERKVGADRWLVVGIGNIAVGEGGEEAGALGGCGVGKTVGDVGVAVAAAGRIGYNYNQ